MKKDLRESRVQSTLQLVKALKGRPLRAFVSASAAGFYGRDPEFKVNEESGPGSDFLARICVDWDAATAALQGAGVRVAAVRTGIALSPRGGALKEMLPLFRMGLGGTLGDPKPWINWIHLDDLVTVFLRALDDETLQGPINGVAPNPVRNGDFSRAVAKALGRPHALRYPTALLRLGIGEAADFMAGGARVRTRYPTPMRFNSLDEALKDLL